MLKQWYEIMGITPELLDMWKSNMREDIITWEQCGIVHAQIALSHIEAIRMQRQMNRNNKKQNDYQLRLVRI